MTWHTEAAELAKLQAPKEACGLVVIYKGREKFIPCQNMAQGNNHFVISAEDYALAEDMGEVVAVFHSHYGTKAEPSQPDLVGCEKSGVEWFIYATPLDTWCSFKPTGYVPPLVGRVFQHGVLDCYTIIRDYYKQTRNIDLPDFVREDKWWELGKNLYLDNFGKAGFVEVETPEIGDVLLLQIASPVPNHAGIYLGDYILHHTEGRLSSKDIYGGMYKKHTTKVLRYAN